MCHINTKRLKWYHFTQVSSGAKSLTSQGWGTGFLPVRTCVGAHVHRCQTTRAGTVLIPGIATDDQGCSLSVSSSPRHPAWLNVSQSDFKLALRLRIALNFWPSCLCILSARIQSMSHHAWFMRTSGMLGNHPANRATTPTLHVLFLCVWTILPWVKGQV